MSEKFGVDFVNQRDKTTEHEWAMKILIYGSEEGIFTGLSLSNYINDRKIDYVNARRVINGTDRASTIANYAEKIAKCLKIECNCEHTNEKVKDGYDIDKAVNYINANALIVNETLTAEEIEKVLKDELVIENDKLVPGIPKPKTTRTKKTKDA